MIKTVGIISAHYLPHLGGVERYVHNLADHLSARGYRIIIITSCLSGMKQKETDGDIGIFRLPCYELMGGRLPVVRPDRVFRDMVRQLGDIFFDWMIVNTRLYILSAWASQYCKKNNIPMFLIEHGTAHMHFSNSVICKTGELYEHMLTAFIKKRCKTFYGVSGACNEWLLHFGIHAAGILYNAVHVEEYSDTYTDYRDRLKLEKEDVIIAFTGRLIREKGIMKLVRAFLTLEGMEKNVWLVIAGDGDLAGEICQLNHSHILMLGSIPHKEVIQLLREADIYCLPTDYPEGFPTAVLEAAMCKCCIVATGNGGTKELIVDDTYGYILKENTVCEIGKCLEKAVSDTRAAAQMAKKAHQRVLERFTWDHTINTLEKLWEGRNG